MPLPSQAYWTYQYSAMSQQEVHNYTCTLPTEDLEKANRELNEVPATRKLEIQTLRERLLRYPGLTPRVDNAFLLKFLRPKKFDQERTFELILNYYKFKKNNEDLYADMTPRTIRTLLDSEMMYVLPQRSRNGETVVVARSGRWDPEKTPIQDVLKLSFMTNSILTESEATQVNGVRFINDLSGLHLGHVTAVSPAMAKKMVHLTQDAFPMRLKSVHYVNEPAVFDYIFAILKPFLKEKITKRIHFHGNRFEELHEYIDPDHLPEEYGGKLPEVCFKEFGKRMLEKQTHFEEEAKFGFVSMTIKQASKKSADAMETLPGTFKKLSVD